MKREFEIFTEFIKTKGLRYTTQRRRILTTFLETERHVSAEELYKLVRKTHRQIGFVTVYRTMKLLSDSGLCGEIDFGDGILRFEHKYAHQHHDHLICVRCGRFIEVIDREIEQLQEKMAQRHKFKPTKHKLEIFGLCDKCC